MDETGERAGDLILVGMFFFLEEGLLSAVRFWLYGGRRWDGLRDDRGGNKVVE